MKKYIEILKTDKVLMIVLAICALLYSVNNYVSFVFAAVFLAICLLYPIEKVLYAYVFMFLFDEVLNFDLLGGSVIRILQPVIVLRLLWIIFKDKPKIRTQDWVIEAFAAVSFIIGYFTIGFKFDSLSFLVNVTLFLLFKIVFSSYISVGSEKIINIYRKTMLFFVGSVLVSIIYGLLFSRFLVDLSANSIIYRFKGTYEPNFASMFIGVALIAWVCIYETYCKTKFTKILSMIITGVLLSGIYITYSITGYGVAIVALGIFFIWNRKETKSNVKNIGAGIIFAIVFVSLFNLFTMALPEYYKVPIPKDSPIISKNEKPNIKDSIPMLQRLIQVNELYKSGKLNELTSGRLGLIEDSLKASFNRPLANMIFGDGSSIQLHHSSYFEHEKFSHNTYADFLNCFGIVGVIAIAGWIFNMTKKVKFLNVSLMGKERISITIIRIALLLFAFTLTYYTNRMFLFFFIM